MTKQNPYEFDAQQLAQMQDKDLLWMIHRDLVDVRRKVANISAVITIWLILSLLAGAAMFATAVQNSSQSDADRYVDCVLAGRSNC